MEFIKIGNAVFTTENYETCYSLEESAFAEIPADPIKKNQALDLLLDDSGVEFVKKSNGSVVFPAKMAEDVGILNSTQRLLRLDGLRSAFSLENFLCIDDSKKLGHEKQTFVESRKGVGAEYRINGVTSPVLTGGEYGWFGVRPYGSCDLESSMTSLEASCFLQREHIKHSYVSGIIQIPPEVESLARSFKNDYPKNQRMYQIIRWIPSNVRIGHLNYYFTDDEVAEFLEKLVNPSDIGRLIQTYIEDMKKLFEIVPRTMSIEGNIIKFFDLTDFEDGCTLAASGIYQMDIECAEFVEVSLNNLTGGELRKYVEGDYQRSTENGDFDICRISSCGKLLYRLAKASVLLKPKAFEARDEVFWQDYFIDKMNESKHIKIERLSRDIFGVNIIPSGMPPLFYTAQVI